VLLAGLVGAGCGVAGAILSSTSRNLPTGPLIVLAVTAVLLVSLAFAPRRGMLWAWLRLIRHRRKVRHENLLADLYRLGEPKNDWTRAYGLPALTAVRELPFQQVAHTADQLQQRGWLEPVEVSWRLTPAGLEEARRVVRNHRLWELFLSRRLELASDHLHRDAEEMEHTLPPAVVAELEQLLGQPALDPHGVPIPILRSTGSGRST